MDATYNVFHNNYEFMLDRSLATTLAGQLLGAGAGRGIGLIFVPSGIMLLIVTAIAYAYTLVEEQPAAN